MADTDLVFTKPQAHIVVGNDVVYNANTDADKYVPRAAPHWKFNTHRQV